MTTEEGVIPGKKARYHIKELRNRLEYLRDKVEELEAKEATTGALEFYRGEAEALEWAIPVLETEATWLYHRTVYAVDRRNSEKNNRCPACGASPVAIDPRHVTLDGGVQRREPLLYSPHDAEPWEKKQLEKSSETDTMSS